MNWEIDEIEKFLIEWNKKNYEPLKDSYILSQIKWHKALFLPRPAPRAEHCSQDGLLSGRHDRLGSIQGFRRQSDRKD